jgi:hypothetical protein
VYTAVKLVPVALQQKDDAEKAATPNLFSNTGPVLVAHVANVLVSAALSTLWVISIESFPKKYR